MLHFTPRTVIEMLSKSNRLKKHENLISRPLTDVQVFSLSADDLTIHSFKIINNNTRRIPPHLNHSVKKNLHGKVQTQSPNAPKFFHSNARPGNEVVASDVFVIICSSLSLALRPVVFVFPWLVNFLLMLARMDKQSSDSSRHS